MRRSLGLGGISPAQPTQPRFKQTRSRSRFVRNGEVPVVVVNSPRVADATSTGRASAVQATLVVEQAARAAAERSLAEALATVRSLQTKLAHAELAYGEALAAERRTRERVEATLQEMVATRELAGPRRGKAMTAAAVETPTPRAKIKTPAPIKPRTAAVKTREPKPVKWWLPSYKAAKQAR